MAWSSYDSEEVDETSPGSGKAGQTITLNPGEKAHVVVERDDGTPRTDDWIIQVQEAVDPTSGDWAEDPPARTYRNKVSQLFRSFVITGPYAFRVYIESEGSTDSIETLIKWRLDGVSL